MRYYSDRSGLKSIYLSTEKEDTKGMLIVSRDTFLTLIHVLFGHLYMDDKMVTSGLPESSLPEGESFPLEALKKKVIK